jgi:hypothetical protein
MGSLRPRERRLLVVAGAVALAVLSHLYVVEPLVERHQQTRDLIAARQSLLQRQQRLLARRERYERDLAGLRAEIGERRGRLLPGDRPPLAASELQKLIKATAQDAGVEVRSERILPTTERGAYTEVPVEVTLSGPIRAITAMLHRLEGTPVLLTLGDVKIRVLSVVAPRELSATLAVSGYIPSPLPASPSAPRPASPPPAPRGKAG